MPFLRNVLTENRIHLVFEVGLWLKGAFALTEIAGGTAALFVTHHFLIEAANVVTQGELAEDPHDLVANYFLHTAQTLSIGTQHFTAFYLLSHGAIKLWLIVGLLRARLWYYPTALMVFALFILYQTYRYSVTDSLVLIVITVVDIAVMVLTWHEYRYLRSAVLNETR